MDAIFLVVAQWWGVVQHYSGWRAFERYVNKYNGLGTVLAALISAAVVFWIAQRYTKRIKQIDSTLEFSRRFHELMQQRVDLNKAYLERRKWENWPPNALETEAAEAWWWRFFDLILYEFDFYQSGLLRRERFIEWMKWRWQDARAPNSLRVSGMNYTVGWDYWSGRPANQDNRLVRFLNDIHRAQSATAVIKKVKRSGPRFWRRVHLD